MKKLDIRTKRQRSALQARPAPYFMPIGPGQAIGFRAGPNTWTARWKAPNGKQHYEALGTCEDSYDVAVAAARRWFDGISGAAVAAPTRSTVRAALNTYLAALREEGRTKAAAEAEGFYARSVDGDAFGSMLLEAVTQEQVREWRSRLRAGRMSKRAGKDAKLRPRQPQTVNRIVRAVVAGLNYAVKHGHAGNPVAWTIDELHVPVKPGTSRTSPRNLLSPEQRAQVKEQCEPIVRDYLRALEYTGARPTEVATLTAEQFDARAGALVIGAWKGNPVEWRERSVPLSAEGAKYFAERCKLYPTGPLFPGVKGGYMPRRYWAKALRLAKRVLNANKAKLESLVAYSFRHARISELLQVAKLDVATVANITGTSVQMIEQTYFHQIPKAITPQLNQLDAQ